MYKFEGENYKKTQDLSVAEIGKLIKKEFKKEFPGLKLSVSSKTYSGGQSIRAYITEFEGNLFTDSFLQYRSDPDSMLSNETFPDYCEIKRIHCQKWTDEVLKVLERLEEIGNSFNMDDSDTQTDYFRNAFYYFSGIDSGLEYPQLEKEKLEYCKRISMKNAEMFEEGKICK